MSFKGIIGKLKEVIITIGHALSRIFRKIIIIDHETLAFLSVVCIVTGSLIGLGICRLSRDDGRAGSFEELQGMIEELQTELTVVREELEVRDSEIEALNGSLTALKPGEKPQIVAVGINLPNDNLRVAVDFVSLQSYNVYGLVAIGVKRVEPESEWYYQDPIIGGNTAQMFTYYWLEGLAGAPEGFLASDTWYRVAIWYTGGYDEVTANSSGTGNEVQVSVDEDIIVQRKEKES